MYVEMYAPPNVYTTETLSNRTNVRNFAPAQVIVFLLMCVHCAQAH